MYLDNLRPGIMYEVIKSSSDGKITKGDLVEIIDNNALAVYAKPPVYAGKYYSQEEWHTPKTCDFESKIWADAEAVSNIKSHMTDPDIDFEITKYTQASIYTASFSLEKAVENLQIAQWLKELKQLRIDVCISPNDL